jgi:hypothetical protein
MRNIAEIAMPPVAVVRPVWVLCVTVLWCALLVGKAPLIVRVDCPEVAPDAMVDGLNEQVIPAGAEGQENETAAGSGAPLAVRVRAVAAELPDAMVTDVFAEVSENGSVYVTDTAAEVAAM